MQARIKTVTENELRANETLDDSDDNPVWVTPPELRGPTLIERARNDIADVRSSAFAHSHHQPGTSSWQHLPYPIDPMIWYLFWVNMDWFISTTPEEPRPLYIHAIVYTPVDPVQSVRKAIYRLIYQLFPATVYTCNSCQIQNSFQTSRRWNGSLPISLQPPRGHLHAHLFHKILVSMHLF